LLQLPVPHLDLYSFPTRRSSDLTPIYDGNFLTYMPEGVKVGGTALLLCIGMQHGIMGLTALLASDYARFLKPKDMKGTIAIGLSQKAYVKELWEVGRR